MDNTEITLLPEMSEKFDIVLTQLMKAKKEIGGVKKDANNPFHKSKYASLGAYLDACEEPLNTHGLILLQNGNGNTEKPFLVSTLIHAESGQWIKSYLPLPNLKGDCQGLGSAITYMRRYSIGAMFGLFAEDDDGAAASGLDKPKDKPKDNQNTPQQKQTGIVLITPNQVSMIRNLEIKLDNECKTKLYNWLKKSYNLDSLEGILADNFSKVFGAFENAVKFMESNKLELAHA